MRPSWFTAASLTTTLPLRPPHLACQALEVYQHSAICPFYSYPFMRAENPTERLKELALILSGSAEETKDEVHGETDKSSPPPGNPTARHYAQPPPSNHKRNEIHHQQPPSPWSRSPTCRRPSAGTAPSSEICTFTHPTFHNGHGISVITTPERIRLLTSSHPLLNHATPPPPPPPASGTTADDDKPYKQTPVPNKGLGLLATSPIRAGTRLMAATPAVLVDDAAWRGMSRRDLDVLIAEAVGSLPNATREGVMGLSVGERWDGGREHGVLAGNGFRVFVKAGGKADGVEFQGVFVDGE